MRLFFHLGEEGGHRQSQRRGQLLGDENGGHELAGLQQAGVVAVQAGAGGQRLLGEVGGLAVPALEDTKAKRVSKLLPVPGLTNLAVGKIAAAGTDALGRSAQAYFFRGEVRPPAEFKEESEGFASGLEPQNR